MSGDTEQHSPQARLLGGQIRTLRKQAGYTGRELGQRLGVGHAAISRYETGRRVPSPDMLSRIIGALAVPAGHAEELLELARRASSANLIGDTGSGLHKHLIDLAELEREAARIVHVSPLVLPGPVQTREYAREIMRSHSPDEASLRVELRMARSRPVHGGIPLEIYVREQVLRDALGGPEVMAEQIRRLLELHESGSVRCRIVPDSLQRWTLAHEGAFVLFEFDDAPSIVHLENFRGPAFLYDREDVEAYRTALATLAAVAMSGGETKRTMAAVLEGWEGART